MKYVILIPIFNDRESLKLLIDNINTEIKGLNHEISLVLINDASSQQILDTYPNIENIRSIELINMKENRGHARCIASGLKYIFEKKEFDFIIPMDGDGEDRPEEIKKFVELSQQADDKSIVGERVKRSEGLIFKTCYQFHKFLTLAFTGQSIKFGNFTCLTKSTVKKMLDEKATWNSFSGSLKKIEKELISMPSNRGKRYFGPSQMSLFKLIIHSFSIIAVFKYNVFLRSAIMLIVLAYLNSYLGNFITLFQVLIVIFNLMIFIISFREQEKDLLSSHDNLDNIKKISH